jgi:hypothetical protein
MYTYVYIELPTGLSRLEGKEKSEVEPQPSTLSHGTLSTSREEATYVLSLLVVVEYLGCSALYASLSRASLSCLTQCPPLGGSRRYAMYLLLLKSTNGDQRH